MAKRELPNYLKKALSSLTSHRGEITHEVLTQDLLEKEEAFRKYFKDVADTMVEVELPHTNPRGRGVTYYSSTQVAEMLEEKQNVIDTLEARVADLEKRCEEHNRNYYERTEAQLKELRFLRDFYIEALNYLAKKCNKTYKVAIDEMKKHFSSTRGQDNYINMALSYLEEGLECKADEKETEGLF